MFRTKKTTKKLLITIPLLIVVAIILLQFRGIFRHANKSDIKDISPITTENSTASKDVESSYIGPKVAPLNFGDKSIEFPYTDNLDGESLIIKSDQGNYTGDSGSDVYFSVTNSSTVDESAILLFYFPGQFIPNRTDPPKTGPTTVTSLEQRVGATWQKQKFFTKNIKIDQKALSQAIAKRKPIPEDFQVKAATQIQIPAGQTVYLKSKISFRSTDSGEFWIEALGKNGGYGLLDPTYTGTHYGSRVTSDSVVSWFASGSQTWSFRKKISINKNNVAGGSNLSNFPVLFSVTDTNLATTANNGKAASGSGEFVFTSSNGTTVLPHEIESYTATTGNIIAWVNVTTLSATNDTNLYIYFGGPASGTVTNQRKQATWNSNYKGVWHLDSATNATTKDSTSNALDGAPTSTVTSSVGQVGNGITFNGTSGFYLTPSTTFNNSVETFSTWLNYNNAGARNTMFDLGTAAAGAGHEIGLCNSISGNACLDTSSYWVYSNINSVPVSSWVYLTIVNPTTSTLDELIYINGKRIFVNNNVALAGGSATATMHIGRRSNNSQFFNGKMDEMRLSGTNLTAGWIGTEYNNQVSPSSFYAIGAMEAKTVSNTLFRVRGKVRFK